MEIKATLQKPYTENERMNFVVVYNHNQGYVIEETETKNSHEKEFIQALKNLDKKHLILIRCFKFKLIVLFV